MPDMPNIPGGVGSWVIAACVAVVSGSLLLRRWLSGDSLDRSGNDAQLSVISMLREQVTAERTRADNAIAALTSATDQIRSLKDEVARLTAQVNIMQTQMKNISGVA